jgi:glycosyltransferase involved in cell wall biosynthesis
MLAQAVRLAVYTDYAYRSQDGVVYAERAFALFLIRLAHLLDGLVVIGRLEPRPGRWPYPLPPEIEFAALPHHPGLLTRPPATAWALMRSLRRLWSTLPAVDAIWLLGPHPLLVPFAVLAVARRRGVALGIRQDFPRYVRSRHPRAGAAWLAADVLEAATRVLARRCPTVVVGPELARRYGRAHALLEIAVSLVREADIRAPTRRYDGTLTALSVGRLETEKNPVLLADIAAQLGPQWCLVVCGEGPLHAAVAARARALGARVELAGYVPMGPALLERYRTSHALLHVSWTEGVPQVLYEAFASGLPVVATAVGGVAEAAGPAALLVGPGDAAAAAGALERIAAEPALRARLIEHGLAIARAHTLEAEVARTAAFLTAELASSRRRA